MNSYKGVDCVVFDLMCWIILEYFFYDFKFGLLSCCVVVGVVGLIVLFLFIFGMVCCVKRCKWRVKEKEFKWFVYVGMIIFFFKFDKDKI